MASDEKKDAEIDKFDFVLQEAGEFGKFQIGHFVLMIIPIIFSASYAVDFIVSSSIDDYRCKIPECDTVQHPKYSENWIENAIPHRNGRAEKCIHYGLSSSLANNTDDFCYASSSFNQSQIIRCDEFVFKTNEHRVMKEFGIYCDENEYKLALIGTFNNIGGFLFMPLAGYLSDKYGRLTLMSITMFGTGICGLAKAFAPSYSLYVAFEFAGAAIGMGVYMSAFILCIEWLSSKYRVLASTTIAGVYPIGEVGLGLAAILFPHYRTFLMIFYTPALIVIIYLWLIPESSRWLHAAGHYDRATAIVTRIAHQNRRILSSTSLDILKSNAQKSMKTDAISVDDNNVSFMIVFQYKTLFIRLIVCSCEWVIATLVYYGLSVNATKVFNDDNKYLTYITTVMAEIPAAVVTYFLLKSVGRRTAISINYVIAGVLLFTSTFVPTNYTFLIRVCFSIGMMSVSSSLAILYVFTAEIWPTAQRNTLMNICSMIGRIGSMLAPLTILLDQIEPSLSIYVFCGAAFTSAWLIFVLPETKDKRLPDTLDETLHL